MRITSGSPGVISKRYAPATLGESRSANTTSVFAPGAGRSEITRAEKRADVAHEIGRREHAKAREAEIVRQLRGIELRLRKIEHRGVVRDLARDAVDDLVHAH